MAPIDQIGYYISLQFHSSRASFRRLVEDKSSNCFLNLSNKEEILICSLQALYIISTRGRLTIVARPGEHPSFTVSKDRYTTRLGARLLVFLEELNHLHDG